MRALAQILALIWREAPRAMRRGLLLSVAASLAGIALLALSGWFILAAGISGLAGLGTSFELFRPSAGVRLLAMTRTGARYAERLLTHDATLRALAGLRGRVLAHLAGADFGTLSALRAGRALNRLTADVDALDGLAIRLVFPGLAGALAALATLAGLWVWATPALAIWAAGMTLASGAVLLVLSGRAAKEPAARAEAGQQALRAGIVAHLRARAQLAVAGQLPEARAGLIDCDAAARRALAAQARIEARAAAALQAAGALTLAGTLAIGLAQLGAGRIGAAQLAMAMLATMGLGELAAALLRGATDLGRMADAASRVAPLIAPASADRPPPPPATQGLAIHDLSVAPASGAAPVLTGIDLTVAPGETVALTGPSGSGKSSLLNAIAGLVPPAAGRIEAAPRQGYLTQRPMLIAGSLRDSLALASPSADAALMTRTLAACALPFDLDRQIGESGAGLSGGEARRLALARVLIRRPDLLLLDEPTEGLDAPTAEAVLAGIRALLPGAAILIAAHRPAEIAAADRVICLGPRSAGT